MKNKIWTAVNLITLAAIAFFAFGESSNAQKKDVWEYKVERFGFGETDNPSSDLNYHGQNGWELVSVDEIQNQRYPVAVFKRKK